MGLRGSLREVLRLRPPPLLPQREYQVLRPHVDRLARGADMPLPARRVAPPPGQADPDNAEGGARAPLQGPQRHAQRHRPRPLALRQARQALRDRAAERPLLPQAGNRHEQRRLQQAHRDDRTRGGAFGRSHTPHRPHRRRQEPARKADLPSEEAVQQDQGQVRGRQLRHPRRRPREVGAIRPPQGILLGRRRRP